jgi:hypothetical protein
VLRLRAAPAIGAGTTLGERPQRLHPEHSVRDAAGGLRDAHGEAGGVVTLPLGVRDGGDESPRHVAQEPDADDEQGEGAEGPLADDAQRAALIGGGATPTSGQPGGQRSDDDEDHALGGIAEPGEEDDSGGGRLDRGRWGAEAGHQWGPG